MTTTYPNRATPVSRQVDYVPAAPLSTVSPPYLMAGCVSLGALILYVLTLAPTTQFSDTSEYLAAAYTLGIPHPPGNPLFVLIAHVFGMLPLMKEYAARINLFAAVTSAISAGCWFLVAERWLRSFVPALWPRRLVALAGALVSATAFTVWNQSVVNEKVYTLSLLSIALILWLIVRWDDQPPGEAHDHYLLLIIYLLALTATNHMMGVLVGPVVLVLLFPPLKQNRPASEPERRIEWSQFLVFTAVWALRRPRAARAGVAVRVPRNLGSDPPLARGPAHRHRDDASHVHVHVRARLLSQLQVRLLAPPRGAAGGTRGAPARLLLPGVVRAVGHLVRDGTRGRHRMGGPMVPRAPAERGAPLGLRHAASGAGVDPVDRQPARRLAEERAAGPRLRL